MGKGGPLAGLKVVELAAIGPGPMAAMMLADLGATVLRIDRREPAALGVPRPARFDLLLRNRPVLPLDLKRPEAIELALELVDEADVLIEGFRPGVAERLGLGPQVCHQRNPRLVYGRITGWGQSGPMAHVPGHDLNYIALTGALAAIGRAGQAPAPPLNLVGDFGGGTLYLVVGILAALHERAASGRGQVVDAAIVDGVASLLTQPHGSRAAGIVSLERGSNPTDSGAPFYDAYPCADGRWVTLAAVEGRFYAEALRVLELDALLPEQWDRQRWPAAKARIAARFRERTQQQWIEAFEGTESCFAPMLTMDEAPAHPHLAARGTYVEIDGVVQPAPAPRFDRTPCAMPEPHRPWRAGDAAETLAPWLETARVERARESGLLD
jgi:crotonobetainyl-CoA:carnitine CoA-transferase CaiB-like acyl-CoA transferase